MHASVSPIKLAQIIDGKLQASLIKESLRIEVRASESKPGLGCIQVGNRYDSSMYIRMKKRACEEIGISYSGRELSEDVTTDRVIEAVQEFNKDPLIHGILLQLPLPEHIHPRAVIEAVSPRKDVDGLTTSNLGRLYIAGEYPLHLPCTPLGVMELLKAYQVPLTGARAAVLGISNIVGRPVAELLQQENATVTACHLQTVDIESITIQADIIVSCIGKPHFIKPHMIKPGCAIIDVGINNIIEDSKSKLVGDVDFEGCRPVAGKISPVPGGVGPMTVVMLMRNTVNSWRNS